MSNYNHYIKIKDKICLVYRGHSVEYLIQMRMLRKYFELSLPKIDVTFACHPQYLLYLKSDPKSISVDALKQNTFEVGGDFGCVFPIAYEADKQLHPILNLINDCKISVQKYPIKESQNHYGIICPEGNFPTESLNINQVSHLRSWVQGRGFKPIVVGSGTRLPVDKRPSPEERIVLARTAGFVVGVECDMLYEAIDAGIPTAMIQSGCQELYKIMCEKPIILGV